MTAPHHAPTLNATKERRNNLLRKLYAIDDFIAMYKKFRDELPGHLAREKERAEWLANRR